MITLSEKSVTQGLHTALGALFVFVPVAKHWPHTPWIGGVACLAWAIPKEFWFDIKFEDPHTSGGWVGGARDFAFYVVGAAAAYLILYV